MNLPPLRRGLARGREYPLVEGPVLIRDALVQGLGRGDGRHPLPVLFVVPLDGIAEHRVCIADLIDHR